MTGGNKQSTTNPLLSENLIKQLNSNDLHYFTALANRIRKLNDSSQQNLRRLPQIYAKAEAVNRRMKLIQTEQDMRATSELILSLGYATVPNEPKKAKSQNNLAQNSTQQSTKTSKTPRVRKEKDYYTSTYQKTRRQGMIISKYLDSDLKARLVELKNCELPYFILHKKSENTDAEDNDPLRDFRYGYYNFDRPTLKHRQSTMYSSNGDDSEYGNEDNNNARMATGTSHEGVTYPSFGSFLSRDGQYALMKSLEDIIVKELENNYPELTNKLPRTTTAQYIKHNKGKRRKKRATISNGLSGIDEFAPSTTTASDVPTLLAPPPSFIEHSTNQFSEPSVLLHSTIVDEANSSIYGKSLNTTAYPGNSTIKKVSFVTSLPKIYNVPSLSDDFIVPYARSEIDFEQNIMNKDEQYLVMPTSSEELEKKLIVTKTIKSGMGILDNIRQVGETKRVLAAAGGHSHSHAKKIGFTLSNHSSEDRRHLGSARSVASASRHGHGHHVGESSSTIVVQRRDSMYPNPPVPISMFEKYKPRMSGAGAMLMPIKRRPSQAPPTMVARAAAHDTLEHHHNRMGSLGNHHGIAGLLPRQSSTAGSNNGGFMSRSTTGSTLNKPDPITKYSEWKNVWMNQLSSI